VAIPTTDDEDFVSQLPEAAVQEHLVELYFTYVHPSFPVVHKRAFFDVFRTGYVCHTIREASTDSL
jgi:hypothetical protein